MFRVPVQIKRGMMETLMIVLIRPNAGSASNVGCYSESPVMTHERRMTMCTLCKLFIGEVLQRILRLVSTRVRGLTMLHKNSSSHSYIYSACIL